MHISHRAEEYQVDHTGAALGSALDILCGAAKLVGLKLNEGPSLLTIGHGHYVS
jgi:hypothetical protein